MTSFGTLYTYMPNARVFKILAAAKLNNLTIEIPAYQHGVTNKSAEFLSRFPTGKVPAFESPEGFCLAESDAIAQYVAQSGPQASQLLGQDAMSSAKIRQWISFFAEEIYPTVLNLVMWRVGLGAFDETTESKALAQLVYGLSVLEKHLNPGTLLVGDKLTLADLTGASTLLWAFMHIVDEPMRQQYPNVVTWYLKVVQDEEVEEIFGKPNFIEKRRLGAK
ncbi:eEF-1B gamma subunit [Fusarium sp. NRRL 25303]|nr:eEF-1B gamma subunit [Fusarium sp. NRRL 25303]